MAKEIKTLKVSMAKEEETIRAFQTFGWTLLNNQEIYVKDSHIEDRFTGRYSVTETTHYVKLTFERDGAKLKNYQQLRQLENAYYSIQEPPKPKWKTGRDFWGLRIIILLPGLVAIGIDFVKGLPFLLAVCAFVYLMNRISKRKWSEWKVKYTKCWKKRNQILSQAEPYLE